MIQTTVITPTTGSDHLVKACQSIASQTYPCHHLIVIDGEGNVPKRSVFWKRVRQVTEKPGKIHDHRSAGGHAGHRSGCGPHYLE